MAITRVPVNADLEVAHKRAKVLTYAVAELSLDLRTVNGLEMVGVLFVSELVQLSRVDLMKIPNFGAKSIERIICELANHGLNIREVPEQDDRVRSA